GTWPGPQRSLRSRAARAGQRRRVPGPVLARGRPAVAGPVAGARILDPQIAVDPGRPGVEPRRRPQRPAGWVAPARIVAAGVRPAAVTAGVDDGPGRTGEVALQLLAPADDDPGPLEVRHVGRESCAVPQAGLLER